MLALKLGLFPKINRVDPAPIASFTTNPSPATGVYPLTVAFTDTSTNEPTSWSWAVVGGTEGVDYVYTVGTSASQNPTIRFDSPGSFTVTLTATNAAGSDESDPETITAEGPPVSGFAEWFYANGLVAGESNPFGIVDGSGDISQWSDLSGNGRHATQATGINQPSLVPNVLNGKKVVRFAGSPETLAITTGLDIFNNKSGATAFMVYKATTSGSAACALYHSNGAVDTSRLFIGKSTGDLTQMSVKRLDADATTTLTGGAITSFKIVSVIMDWANGDGFIYQNGALINSNLALTTSGNTSPTNSLFASIGSSNTTNFFAGDIAEIITYNSTLTALERASIESWLNLKYALY